MIAPSKLAGKSREILWELAISPKSNLLLPARIALLRALLPWRLDRLSLHELLEELTPKQVARTPSKRELAHIHRLTELLLRESSLVRTTCLYRSLIRYLLLREAGLEVRFVMGVRANSPDVEGHAWLEAGDQPFMEVLLHEYATTFAHPPPRGGP